MVIYFSRKKCLKANGWQFPNLSPVVPKSAVFYNNGSLFPKTFPGVPGFVGISHLSFPGWFTFFPTEDWKPTIFHHMILVFPVEVYGIITGAHQFSWLPVSIRTRTIYAYELVTGVEMEVTFQKYYMIFPRIRRFHDWQLMIRVSAAPISPQNHPFLRLYRNGITRKLEVTDITHHKLVYSHSLKITNGGA